MTAPGTHCRHNTEMTLLEARSRDGVTCMREPSITCRTQKSLCHRPLRKKEFRTCAGNHLLSVRKTPPPCSQLRHCASPTLPHRCKRKRTTWAGQFATVTAPWPCLRDRNRANQSGWWPASSKLDSQGTRHKARLRSHQLPPHAPALKSCLGVVAAATQRSSGSAQTVIKF